MINTKYVSAKHSLLVAKRKAIAALQSTDERKATIKAIDREIGGLAAVFNPKISAKARAWLENQ